MLLNIEEVALFAVLYTCILWFCAAAHHHAHVTQTHAVDPNLNTCTIKAVADHHFFDQVGDSQESTVRILLL